MCNIYIYIYCVLRVCNATVGFGSGAKFIYTETGSHIGRSEIPAKTRVSPNTRVQRIHTHTHVHVFIYICVYIGTYSYTLFVCVSKWPKENDAE